MARIIRPDLENTRPYFLTNFDFSVNQCPECHLVGLGCLYYKSTPGHLPNLNPYNMIFYLKLILKLNKDNLFIYYSYSFDVIYFWFYPL